MNLDEQSQEKLDQRHEIGYECVKAAAGRDVVLGDEDEDITSFVKDAIADILTFHLGPRGFYRWQLVNGQASGPGHFVGGQGIVDQAHELVSDAVESWRGDAEDYAEYVGERQTAVEKIGELLDEVQAYMTENVVPGISDDSVAEARRDTLEEVLAILHEKQS